MPICGLGLRPVINKEDVFQLIQRQYWRQRLKKNLFAVLNMEAATRVELDFIGYTPS